jgi:2,3,4,5-tetrahydropyridine-2,6-dicarboxylate N-succinyltransferase
MHTLLQNRKNRIVPGGVVHATADIHPSVIVMPSFIGPQSYIGENTMVDTWAIVGQGAQVGAFVHLAGGVVLEEYALVGDHAFLGSRVCIGKSCTVGQGAILGAQVRLNKHTPIVHAYEGPPPFAYVKKETSFGHVPSGAVVIPGHIEKSGCLLPCALIIKWRDTSHDSKVGLNTMLRDLQQDGIEM